jgi:hypothetical protein
MINFDSFLRFFKFINFYFVFLIHRSPIDMIMPNFKVIQNPITFMFLPNLIHIITMNFTLLSYSIPH